MWSRGGSAEQRAVEDLRGARLLLCVVRGAHHRARFDVREAERERFRANLVELGGRDVARDG